MPKRTTSVQSSSLEPSGDFAPLTAAQKRQIERELRDIRDSRRYIIKSVLLPDTRRPWELYYNISDDTWAMDLEGGTLFKRRKSAQAVANLLGKHVRIEQVKLGRGKRIIRARRDKVNREPQTSKSKAAKSRRRASRDVQAAKSRR